jgi:hypothetical protein
MSAMRSASSTTTVVTGEVEGALFEHVLEATGARDDDVDAEVEGLARDVVRGAAVDADDAATAVVGELGQLLLDLGGQFARRHEHQGHGLAGRALVRRAIRGSPKARVLPEPVIGLADDVASGEGVGDARPLGWGRLR